MNFDITKRDFERNTTLFEKKVINEKTYDSVRNSYQRAQETLIQAEAQYEMAKRDFESLKVRAPFDGIVVDRNGNSGQLISPGFVFGRVLDISKVDVETYITSEQITSLKIGSRADIGNVAGEVVSINRAADKDSRNFLIKIRFDNKDNSFIEGSFVQGSVYTEYYENVLLIPNKSLLYDENGYFIFLHEDGKAVRLEVFVKAKNKDKVYVSGINETSEIIVSGQSIVKDGSLVSISEE
jgi:RND family efflux transporter MFP subunit